MKLSISNIAWESENNDQVFREMKKYGFSGIEIAPTKIIPEAPYDHADNAIDFYQWIHTTFGFAISSMQSIWYGVSQKIFGSENEREYLLEYTKKAILFAERIGCRNLVFGCPRNRAIPDDADPAVAVCFFRELGNYAFQHHTVIGLEANPPIYHTNYINTTVEALDLIRLVDSKGFRLNLDVGTMIENNEELTVLNGSEEFINHVHISEPGLGPLNKHLLHQQLASFLNSISYKGFVSIETGYRDNLNDLSRMMKYVAEIFS